MNKNPIRVAVTGAAGNIGYALLFRIASVAMFGPDQPVALNLVEIEPGMGALKGVAMELDDCAFPLLTEIVQTSDLSVGFRDIDWALLVGSVPRKQGMERADLLGINGKVFVGQGKAIIDARGASSATFAANAIVDTVRDLSTPTCGGGICEVGHFVDGGECAINPHRDICSKEITLVGSWVYNSFEYPNAYHFLQRAERIGLPVSSLVTHKFPLDQIDEAFQVNLRQEGIKVVVEVR